MIGDTDGPQSANSVPQVTLHRPKMRNRQCKYYDDDFSDSSIIIDKRLQCEKMKEKMKDVLS